MPITKTKHETWFTWDELSQEDKNIFLHKGYDISWEYVQAIDNNLDCLIEDLHTETGLLFDRKAFSYDFGGRCQHLCIKAEHLAFVTPPKGLAVWQDYHGGGLLFDGLRATLGYEQHNKASDVKTIATTIELLEKYYNYINEELNYIGSAEWIVEYNQFNNCLFCPETGEFELQE